MNRLFNWFDSLTALSPLEQAKQELEHTKAAYLEAKSQEEYYMGLAGVLEARQARLASYVEGTK